MIASFFSDVHLCMLVVCVLHSDEKYERKLLDLHLRSSSANIFENQNEIEFKNKGELFEFYA
jgi:hypothetical protein